MLLVAEARQRDRHTHPDCPAAVAPRLEAPTLGLSPLARRPVAPGPLPRRRGVETGPRRGGGPAAEAERRHPRPAPDAELIVRRPAPDDPGHCATSGTAPGRRITAA